MSARAGIVVTGTEVLTGRVQRPQRPVAGRAPARARRRPRVHDDRRRPPGGHARGARASWPSEGLDLVLTSGGLGPDRRRPHGRGRRRLPGARDGARRGARGAHRGDPAPARQALPAHRHGGDPGRATASRRSCPRGRPCSSPSAPRPGWSCRPRTGAAAHDRGAAGAAARAAADVGGRRSRPRRCAPRSRGATVLSAADAAPVRDPRVGDRRDPARGRARGRRARAARGHDLPETRRGRGRDALRARRRRTPTRPSRRVVARAPRRHAVLRRRRDRRRAGGRAAARRGRGAAAHASPPPSRAPAACWPPA